MSVKNTNSKSFVQSKIDWAGILIVVLGVLPLVLDLINVVAPEAAVVAGAIVAFVGGLTVIVLRTWFSDGKQINKFM